MILICSPGSPSYINQCVDFHPWLNTRYVNAWPVSVLMQQILARTTHTYDFKDWGDEELVETMLERMGDQSDEEEVDTPIKNKNKRTKVSILWLYNRANVINRLLPLQRRLPQRHALSRSLPQRRPLSRRLPQRHLEQTRIPSRRLPQQRLLLQRPPLQRRLLQRPLPPRPLLQQLLQWYSLPRRNR